MQNYFMRVRVALPSFNPLRCGRFIVGLDEVCTWVKFKYERLPYFLFFVTFVDLLGMIYVIVLVTMQWRKMEGMLSTNMEIG